MQLEIATGFYQSFSLPLAAQRCINWEPIVPQGSALNERALRDPRGILSKLLTGAGIIGINRGAQLVNEVPYYINGTNLYSISESNVVTDHGTINGVGRVSLANNGRFLVIVVPGIVAYAFDNEDDSLTEITDVSFRPSDTVSFKDGFFIFSSSDGDVFFTSNLNDPLTYTDATLTSGAGTIIVSSPAVFEELGTPTRAGAYNTVVDLIVDLDVINILNAASTTFQPNLFYHPQAFSLASVKLPKLFSTDTLAVTEDGFSLRVSKYADGDANTQKVRFDLLPAYAALNPWFAGHGWK